MIIQTPTYPSMRRPNGRGLGWRRDRPGIDPHAKPEHLYGALRRGETMLAKADLTQWRDWHYLQGNAGSCVAFERRAAKRLNYRMHGGPDVDSSARFSYWTGRREEYANMPETQLDFVPLPEDHGTEPRLMLLAESKVGFALESDYPYNDNADAIKAQPGDDVFVKAFAARGLEWARIDTEGMQACKDIALALRMKCTVGIGMFVDSAFMWHASPSAISSIDTRDPQGGGHMLTILKIFVEDGTYDALVDNWWPPDWGFGYKRPEDGRVLPGVGRISSYVLGNRDIVGDMLITTQLPELVLKVAA